MSKVAMSVELSATPDQVWQAIGGFNALPDWHPLVEKSVTDGEGGAKQTTRTLSLLGGGSIVERLDDVDEHERHYSYSILQGPLPVSNYRATIRVEEKDGGCIVHWSSEFDATGPESDSIKAIEGVYTAGLDNLKKMFGG